MTLAAFQHAFAELAASPRLVEAVRADPETAFPGLDLTPRERRRLVHVARQRGIEAQCAMYRITRLTALNSILPLTLAALKPVLRDIVDAYWEAHPVHEVRFLAEASRFLDFLESRPDLLAFAGPAASPLLSLARIERATEEVRLDTPEAGADPVAILLPLDHPADALLAAAPSGLAALAAVAPSPTSLVITASPGEAPQLFALAAA